MCGAPCKGNKDPALGSSQTIGVDRDVRRELQHCPERWGQVSDLLSKPGVILSALRWSRPWGVLQWSGATGREAMGIVNPGGDGLVELLPKRET